MKVRIFRLSVVAIVTMVSFALLGSMVSLAAPVEPAVDRATSHNALADTEIQSRRLISIPFGIDNLLELSSNGREITVEGHGKCPDGGETFRIRVFVTQDGRSTQAKGRTEGNCDAVVVGGWQAIAEAQGRKTTFEAGDAHARAMVVIFGSAGGADVGQWEKDVTLE